MTKQITTEYLESLTWEIAETDASDHVIDSHIIEVGIDENGESIEGKEYNSYLYATVKLRSIEHPDITYTIQAVAHNKDDRHSLTGAYDFTVEMDGNDANDLDAPDFKIFDCDGDEISEREAVHQIGTSIEDSAAWENAVASLLPSKPVDDIDIDEDSDMDTIELSRDHGPDIRFQGEQIASASSYEHDGSRNIRWTELTLYRTRGGKLICEEVGRTKWVGERTKRGLHITDTEAELIEALGHGWLAKALYDDAGIDHAVEID